jgi:hypothetical protein
MADVKIILEKGETQQEAEEALLKALNSHSSGDIHFTESFEDPAMVDATHKMEKMHKDMYNEMIREINEALDDEYSDGF